MLRSILLICCVIIAFAGGAQDRIYLTNGSNIEAKVKEVNPRNIVYRRWDNQEGADYTITRREVLRIIYQNGTAENFTARGNNDGIGGDADGMDANTSHDGKKNAREKAASAWGKNIIALAPIQMTTTGVAGVGIHYERFLDAGRMFSFYLPAAITFYTDEPDYYYGTAPSTLSVQRVYTTFYPGVKIYPGGSMRRASYSIGGSFILGSGTRFQRIETANPGGGNIIVSYKEASTFKAGFMVNNGLNIMATKNFYLGIEIGLGLLYYDNTNNTTNTRTIDAPEAQFNFKFGYRW